MVVLGIAAVGYLATVSTSRSFWVAAGTLGPDPRSRMMAAGSPGVGSERLVVAADSPGTDPSADITMLQLRLKRPLGLKPIAGRDFILLNRRCSMRSGDRYESRSSVALVSLGSHVCT